MALAAATALVSFSSAGAATDTWIAGSGNWSDAGNWSGGVPVNGSSVLIGETDGVARTITYDYTGPTAEIELLVSLDGATGSSADTISMSANTLTAFDPVFGNHGNGAMDQSGGTFTTDGKLFLGVFTGSNGWYTLGNNGTLTNDAGGEEVGGDSAGSFVQTGGTNTLTNSGLGIADGSGTGSYTLSGSASVLSTTTETTGNEGTGAFTQNGGTNTVSSEFNVGNSSGGNGTFNLNGGTLTVGGIEYISGLTGSTGTFIQTGGTNTVTSESIVIAGIDPTTGQYTLTGGSASAPDARLGTFGP